MTPSSKTGVDRYGRTQFYNDCVAGNDEKVEDFLSKNMMEDIERGGESSISFQHHARSVRLYCQILTFFYSDNDETSPLHGACLSGQVKVVELLIAKGCKIDRHNTSTDTPLTDAITNNHVEVVKLLLNNGANPWLKVSHRREEDSLQWHDRHVSRLTLMV